MVFDIGGNPGGGYGKVVVVYLQRFCRVLVNNER